MKLILLLRNQIINFLLDEAIFLPIANLGIINNSREDTQLIKMSSSIISRTRREEANEIFSSSPEDQVERIDQSFPERIKFIQRQSRVLETLREERECGFFNINSIIEIVF